jgi:hypothetical protein
MALIPIDDSLNIAEEIADLFMTFITDSFDFIRNLTTFEILAQKQFRSGLNADNLATNIMKRFKEAGIPSGPLVNGAPNVMEAFTVIIAEEIVDAIQNQMRVDVAIFPGGTVQATGANGGGPLVALGATVNAQSGVGVAR